MTRHHGLILKLLLTTFFKGNVLFRDGEWEFEFGYKGLKG